MNVEMGRTSGVNLETRRGRLPAGDKILACKHIRDGGRINPKILAMPLKEVAQQLKMPPDFDTSQAKWFVICAHCAIKGDPHEGIPYQLLVLRDDVVIG